MEDIASYDDDQIGAAVRSLHDQARDSLARYLSLQPVIDGVEGAYTRPASADPAAVKFIGNVPAAKPEGGTAASQRLARRQGGSAGSEPQAGRHHHRAR